MKLKVTLNGTDANPWHAIGLTQNPFPQIPKAEYTPYLRQLEKLGGDPIPSTDYIREVLAGWSEEFIELCCQKFVPGGVVRFTVEIRKEDW